MSAEEKIREAVAADLHRNGVECHGCGDNTFEVEVWGVGDGINGEEVRAAAICESCSARLNVPVDGDILEEFL